MTFFKKLINFLKSSKFLINIILIGIVWIAIVFGTRSYFGKFTHHGEKVDVPNLLTFNVEDIPILIGKRKLQVEIIDSVYNPDLVDGTIIYQNPMPTDSNGVWVKEDRVIRVRVSKQSRLVSVPEVRSKSERFAEAILMSKGLRTKKTYVPSIEDQGVVIKQSFQGKTIEVGKQVPINSVIELTIGKRSEGELVDVPNLVGLTIKEANDRFQNSSLRIVPFCSDCVSASDSLNARVIRQTPIAGDSSRVPEGTAITIFASIKKEPIEQNED